MRVGPSLSAYILCLGGLHLIRSKTVGEQLMNPHWAWSNFFICYDVPGSHANHGPQIHTCSCRTRERNLPGRRDAVVTTLLILRYKPFPHDYTDLRRAISEGRISTVAVSISTKPLHMKASFDPNLVTFSTVFETGSSSALV
jgi:hypothetical protein